MSEEFETYSQPTHRRRRTERKKEALAVQGELQSENSQTPQSDAAPVPDPASENDQKAQEHVVPGGRAARNRRQPSEPAASESAPETAKRSSPAKTKEAAEIPGTRGYQPEKPDAGRQQAQNRKNDAVKPSPREKQPADKGKQKPGQPQKTAAAGKVQPQDIRTTGPIPQQGNRMTGPIPQQNGYTTGPVPPQNVRTTGPIPQQNGYTTGPVPPQNVRTTGPIPQQNGYTTGPVPPQNMRTTGPIPQQNARTTGPIPQQNGYTTGPVPQQNVRMTGPIPQQNGFMTGPVPQQNRWGSQQPSQQGGRMTGPVPMQTGRPSGTQPNGAKAGQPLPAGGRPMTEGYGPEYPQRNYPPQTRENPAADPKDPRYGYQSGPSQGYHPSAPVQPGPARIPSDQGHGGQNAQKKKNPIPVRRILTVLLAAAVLVGGSILLARYLRAKADQRAMQEYVQSYDDLFVPGVYVDGISLQGMSMVQAKAMIESNAQQRSNVWSVNLTYNGQTVRTITASDLSMTVDVQETLNDAWAQGHTGSLEERKAQMDQLMVTPYQGYTADPSGDTSVIDTILQELSGQIYRAPKDATIASFNPSLTYPFTFNDEVIGRKLNAAAVKEEIYRSLSALESSSVELVLETTMPDVTVESLKASLLELRGSATTPISSSSAEERNANIRTAFSKISGTIIQPGAQFSFNNTVGPRTEKNGFLPAIEYAYGELSDGIGGGVCQASTTVYLAAVRAGMEIIKREPHSDAVSYIEYGKDATVYWYSNHKIDMVFKNTTDSPIYITAAVQSSPTRRTNLVCVVNIYGATLNGLSYDIVTQETVIEAPLEPEYVKDRNAEYVTYTDQQKVVRKASNGCSVDSWRVTYENGREVDRKFMYTDIYKPKAERIYVGVTPR